MSARSSIVRASAPVRRRRVPEGLRHPVSATPSEPVRTCVGCRERAGKRELLRVVADDRGAGREVVPDPTGRAPGRGAHLHPTPTCLALAVRRRAFPRALRAEGPLSTAALEEYVRERSQQDQQDQHRTETPS